MIEHIVKKFPLSSSIYIITTKLIRNEIQSSDLSKLLAKRVKWIIIESHNQGPAYSIYKSLDNVPTGKPLYISYCDITWDWDNGYPFKIEENSEAAIFVHEGFHPHLVNNSFSAFCKKNKSLNILEEIKEKGSFTDNWMDELLSIGLFYISKIEVLYEPIKALIEENNSINGEFYPSLLFNYLVRDGINVDLIKVKSFVHYGTPEQFTDFLKWGEYFSLKGNTTNHKKNLNLPSVILASGKGSRMKSMTNIPKPLLEIAGDKLLMQVINNLPINKKNLNIVINEDSNDIKKLDLESSFHIISNTNSQFDSILLSLDVINKMNQFLFCSCDCYGEFDFDKLDENISRNEFDVICFGFKPTLLQSKLAGHTYFTPYEDKIKSIHIKSRNSIKDFGLAGFFFINSSSKFIKIINQINKSKTSINIEREIIVDDIVKLMVDEGLSIGWIPLKNYIHLGSINEFKEFDYWHKHILGLIE